jgi:hypothetical protein
VIESIKPGVKWTEMHLLTERIIIEGLQKLGLINPESDLEKLIE